MLKLSDNPPMLPEAVTDPAALDGTWWVAHTKARHEKSFAWELGRAGIGYFLPMMHRVTVSGGRKRQVLKPLFTSYVFFCGGDEDRYRALATDRLCTVIPVHDRARFVAELQQIHLAVEGGAEMDPYPGLATGRAARVTAGAFEGMEGRIIEWHGRTRLLLQVSMLGQGAAVEIDADLLEPIERDEPVATGGGM